MIKPGEPWGRPTTAPPDLEVAGGDADLASSVAVRPGVLVRFRPDPSSDLARAVGLGAGSFVALGVEVPLDLLRVDDGPVASNMIVLGIPPEALGRFARRFGANVRVDSRPVFHGPCTTVVISTGQFRRGLDLVPAGIPATVAPRCRSTPFRAGNGGSSGPVWPPEPMCRTRGSRSAPAPGSPSASTDGSPSRSTAARARHRPRRHHRRPERLPPPPLTSDKPTANSWQRNRHKPSGSDADNSGGKGGGGRCAWADRTVATIASPMLYAPETFTDSEAARLRPYFTNLDGPVFALTNLPEVVKGGVVRALLALRQEPAAVVPRRVRR